jgi:hypothetical protein
LSDFNEIAVKTIHKYLSKKVGFWEYKLVHSHGVRSSKVLSIEKEEEQRQDIIKERKKERAIGKEATCVASFVHFN